MCGLGVIVGLHGYRPERWRLEAMATALQHRGPDDDGFYEHATVGFGFRRLAILDLTDEARQPMLSRCGRYAIVFNGAIFNYIELRDVLRAKGHRFHSTGDTEVLLTAFVEWGEACLPRLNGMWAFVIHDRATGLVFGSRDRFGIKPLYIYRRAAAILLASEIKALTASGLYEPAINWTVASRYLLQGIEDEGPETFFEGVRQITPGTSFTIDPAGQLTVRSYWSLPSEEESAPSDATEQFGELFEDAVRLRMRSDVPVGVCLSGGIDSTSIICAMAREIRSTKRNSPLWAFSYNPPEFDESPYLDATVAATGARLARLDFAGRHAWDLLEEVLVAQDEPVHSMSAIVGYRLMGLAREMGVTVILNGQGADETAAGYPSDFPFYWHDLLLRRGLPEALREIRRFSGLHGASFWAAAGHLLRRALLHQMGRMGAYGRLVEAHRRDKLARDEWFTPALARHVPVGWQRRPATLDAHLADEVTRFPLPLYLRVEDRNAMANSVETRLPFMDHRLILLLFALPPEEKVRGPWNKYILREAMRGKIPEVVRSRSDKFGFPTPVHDWVGRELYEPLRDVLGSRYARERGIYQTDRVLADLESLRQGATGDVDGLIRIAQFELWTQLIKRPEARQASVPTLESGFQPPPSTSCDGSSLSQPPRARRAPA